MSSTHTQPSHAARPDDHFFVTEAELLLAPYQALVSAPEYGAVTSFVGTVRSPNRGQSVRYIDYQGYDAMMYAQMKVLSDELRARFDVGGVVIAHRLGRLEPGDASIVIVVSSPHRRAALEACHAAIDRAKELLPVWKYEVTDESATWVQGSSQAAEPL